jgi:hypothetical protein
MFEVMPGSSAYGARLLATQSLSAGQLIHQITQPRITHQPTYRSIQIGPNTHLEDLGVIVYLNHSCQPNTLVDTTALAVYAARDIAAGEELTFFYPSTEWEMDRPFICLCGAAQCVRLVAGAKYLSVDTLSRHFINQHIRALILQTLTQPVEVLTR